MNAKTLNELVNRDDPAIALMQDWAAVAENHIEFLPPSILRDEALLEVQVTTHSTLGALAYDTGGILVDHGWLRFLGSGHRKFTRTLPAWNRGRSDGLYLVADDAIGGFFALNGGAFGSDAGNVYYRPPDNLRWEPLGMGLTDFFRWSLTSRLADFYQELRWPAWRDDLAGLSADECINFDPFLWTTQGSVAGSDRRPIPAAEAYDLKVDIVRQLSLE
jgi:hypothetical protein